VQCRREGRLLDAKQALQHALRIEPDAAEDWGELGLICLEMGQLSDAEAALRRSLAIRHSFAQTINLGAVLLESGRADEAAKLFSTVARGSAELAAVAYNNLGNAYAALHRPIDALHAYGAALERRPDMAGARSNRLLRLHYDPGQTRASIFQAHREWQVRHAAAVTPLALPTVDPAPKRRLRVGYVSGDLWNHPVAWFLLDVLRAHDRASFEVFCYSNRAREDEMTARLKQAADHWRMVASFSDKALAEQIRADRIDILVDLSGHTALHRLMTFALRPAPVQITWLGYWDTSGLNAMDYIILDRNVPVADERWFVEKVLRLPHTRLCYSPPAYAPPVSDLPSEQRGRVTFGSFNRLEKLTPAVTALWATLLKALPRSRLLLKWKTLGDLPIRSDIESRFAAHGISAERLDLRGYSSHAEMLAQYSDVDVALDPFPFSGGATSCEALWMGVPVITLVGASVVSRQTESFLSQLRLDNLAASDPDAYVSIALALATDIPRRRMLRHSLRERMSKSSLCDAAQFTQDLEAAFRQAWEARQPGDHTRT
jgi:protein O-GlcNAc transferase